MTDKVVSLSGSTPPVRKPHPRLIAELERLLEMAEAGEITGMAAGYMHHDGLSSFSAIGVCVSYGMVGALELAKAHIISDMASD